MDRFDVICDARFGDVGYWRRMDGTGWNGQGGTGIMNGRIGRQN